MTLAELPEQDATGEIAAIYDEIRRFCGVPYVSSMQRHLATRPGWLEFVWAAVRPAFASGRAQTAARRLPQPHRRQSLANERDASRWPNGSRVEGVTTAIDLGRV